MPGGGCALPVHLPLPGLPRSASVSLGSGVVYLSAGAGDGAIRQEVADLAAELAVWSVSYGLHPEWFSPEEMEAALDYTQTPEYDGQNIYIGAWLVSDPERGDLRVPLTRPESGQYTFAEIYRLLEALEWETLEGTETDFSFTGADGSLYAFPMTCGRTSMDICSAAARRTVSRRKTARTMVRSPSGGAWRR